MKKKSKQVVVKVAKQKVADVAEPTPKERGRNPAVHLRNAASRESDLRGKTLYLRQSLNVVPAFEYLIS